MIRAVRPRSLMTAIVVAALAAAAPAYAQGRSGSAPGKLKKPKPPSSSSLPGASSAAGGTSPLSTVTGASPLSWLDDASVLEPGSVLLTLSGMRWSGGEASEVYLPVIDASLGVTRRVQIGATIPRIAGAGDGTTPVARLGTSYFSAKVALLPDSDVKLAISPLVEVLGTSAAQSLPAGESRYQFGLPVSIEAERGPARLFAAAGFFTRGAWFTGGGAGFILPDPPTRCLRIDRPYDRDRRGRRRRHDRRRRRGALLRSRRRREEVGRGKQEQRPQQASAVA
jgi:hypothetical protein